MTPLTTTAPTTEQRTGPRMADSSYDREAVRTGVVHLGVGNFHRSHQAVYLDRVLSTGDLDWGICGVGLLPSDEPMAQALRSQDGLYTLVTVAPEPGAAAQSQTIGSLVDYLFAPEDPQAVLERLAHPTTRIVSLTITEGGYGVDDSTGEFSPDDPLIQADLEPGSRTDGSGADSPRSAVGYVVAALRLRRERGLPPFTVVSCDNIQANGQVARTAVTGFARHHDADLAAWIETTVSFPSSMVDRITPVTTEQTRALVRENFGVDDRVPVLSEAYLQWVLEDDFVAGRPDLEAVGVQLVSDVAPYELMKLRLLNASHQVMSYLGLLAHLDWVHEVCSDPVFAAFLRRYMHREARPTLAPVPGTDLDAYCRSLMVRFAGDAVGDTLQRQVVDGSERLAKFVVPVLRDQLARNGEIDCSVATLAAWGRYLEQHLDEGAGRLQDRRADELLTLVARDREHPGTLLELTSVFGDLGSDDRLRQAYRSARQALRAGGARQLVTDLAGAR